MSDLRNKLIRLAHEKPELREHLLPLIQKQAQYSEHYMCFVSSAQDDMDAAAIKAGLPYPNLYEKDIVGFSIPHIEIFGDKAEIAKVVKKFKGVCKRVK